MQPAQTGAIVVAGGAVALTMYNRGVWQALFKALSGFAPVGTGAPFIPDTLAGDNVGTGQFPGLPSSGGDTPPSGGAGGAGPIIGATDPLGQAVSAVLAGGNPRTGGSNDWLNWCLQFVDMVRARLGQSNWFGAYDASAASRMQPLKSGVAPRGAVVFFGGSDSGHTGISNGNCQYTSVGITSGVSVRDYCSNPNYLGYVL